MHPEGPGATSLLLGQLPGDCHRALSVAPGLSSALQLPLHLTARAGHHSDAPQAQCAQLGPGPSSPEGPVSVWSSRCLGVRGLERLATPPLADGGTHLEALASRSSGGQVSLSMQVREVFKSSPFLVGDDCVSIMNGTDEGVSAWITVNFLTGTLKAPGRSSVGMLDLGGGSTQITFLPRAEGTLQASPPGHLTALRMFNRTYKLYSYSYLGLGLMSARLAILGGVEGQPAKDGEELASPCLPPGFTGEWEHAEVAYRIAGRQAGTLYELCASRVSEILRGKVHRTPEEAKHLGFYAFSYYYDLAASAGLIDAEKGGSLVVGDFETAAKYVCRTLETRPPGSPFACMDLTYVSLLLQELGFPRDKVLKLTRKIDSVETSWALGATFHYIDALGRPAGPAA